MEKRKPHYPLAAVKAIVKSLGIESFTTSAKLGAAALGFQEDAAVAAVLALESRTFYKSMTTHVDHRVWQDVYHAPCPNGKTAYIKLTAREDRVVIQFKEQ